jgi:hypothetical protein
VSEGCSRIRSFAGKIAAARAAATTGVEYRSTDPPSSLCRPFAVSLVRILVALGVVSVCVFSTEISSCILGWCFWSPDICLASSVSDNTIMASFSASGSLDLDLDLLIDREFTARLDLVREIGEEGTVGRSMSSTSMSRAIALLFLSRLDFGVVVVAMKEM